MVSFLSIIFLFAGGGIYLISNGYDMGGYFSFGLGVLALMPKIIDVLKKKTKS